MTKEQKRRYDELLTEQDNIIIELCGLTHKLIDLLKEHTDVSEAEEDLKTIENRNEA